MFWSVLFPLRKLSGRLRERLGTESRLIPADAAEPSVSETKRAAQKRAGWGRGHGGDRMLGVGNPAVLIYIYLFIYLVLVLLALVALI